ncbi:putative oligopeptide transporter [Xylaria palmicola]|nr:putative oligopeptide transporter [Xylaria palmicola]
MTTPKIAIVGAGPVGCVLARILTLANIPVTVFESDASPNYRGQGGTLDLHPNTGLKAVKTAQLWDEYKSKARFDSQYLLLCDKDLNPFIEIGNTGTSWSQRPEIDRAELRRLLIHSLPEGTIRWGHKLQRVEDGNRLVFEHTTESGFDLVVGCDGAFSRVRNHVSADRPLEYSGVMYHQFLIPDAENTARDAYRRVNRGNIFSHANGRQFSQQQLGDGSIHVTLAAVRPEDWIEKCAIDKDDFEGMKRFLLDEMRDWCPQLREGLEKTRGSHAAKNLFQLPPGWHWDHKRGTTLIGDAAHVMLPFAGEGVNLGLDDAQKLAAAIINAVQNGGGLDELDSRVAEFEKEMFKRMELFQRQTDEVTKLWMFTEGDLRRVVPAALASHSKLVVPTALQYPTSALIHTWWFLKESLSIRRVGEAFVVGGGAALAYLYLAQKK